MGYGKNAPDGVYKGFRALNTQNYIEANIKLGVQHEAARLFTLAGGADSDSLFVIGNKPVALKARTLGFDGDGIIGRIFRSPTHTGGLEVTPNNPNDINPVTSIVTLFSDATITDDGTEVFAPTIIIGGSSNNTKGVAATQVGQEKILRPNTTYLLRLTNVDTQSMEVSAYISWYEGDLDLPLS